MHRTLVALRMAGLGVGLAVAAAAYAPAVQAAPVGAGTVSIDGFINDVLPSGSSAATATGIDFFGPIDGAGTGFFNAFDPFTTTGTIQDIPEGSIPIVGLPALSIDDFFTLTNGVGDIFVFDLVSITDVDRTLGLGLAGTATVSATIGGVSYSSAPATFVLTTQGTGFTTFSAQTITPGGVVDVPEPTTLALFGMGLLGLGAVARRRLG